MLALLLILGILGIFGTEVAAYRTTAREARAYDQLSNVEAVDFGSAGPPMASMPGIPY